MRRTCLAVAICGIFACGKAQSTTATATASGDVAPAGSALPNASPSLAAAPSSARPAASSAQVGWQGTYKSMVGPLYIPTEFKVRWKPPENPAGVGEGGIALSVESSTGRVRGTLDGPLGPATLQGYVSDGKLAATIVRKDPADHGFTGTLDGAVTPDHAEGTIHVTLSEASAIRTASFQLSPAPAAD
jgi:hypothetical protein